MSTAKAPARYQLHLLALEEEKVIQTGPRVTKSSKDLKVLLVPGPITDNTDNLKTQHYCQGCLLNCLWNPGSQYLEELYPLSLPAVQFEKRMGVAMLLLKNRRGQQKNVNWDSVLKEAKPSEMGS